MRIQIPCDTSIVDEQIDISMTRTDGFDEMEQALTIGHIALKRY